MNHLEIVDICEPQRQPCGDIAAEQPNQQPSVPMLRALTRNGVVEPNRQSSKLLDFLAAASKETTGGCRL
ncbi:hypothetical protein EOD04_18635 [Mesorhizobium sp. M2C.T.Ca.TU.009.01.2.1]|nr:hypothetical protein EOD04_18635 [Mesorhizobium sp. M2C.T.Ca.TU.009.01.2.1]